MVHDDEMNIDVLQNMLKQGQDNFLLRFGLGQALLKEGQIAECIPHLEAALQFDPQHSSSWKLLAKALALQERKQDAIKAYQQGIEVAEKRGDVQAAKEMKVFLKRLQKNPG